MNNDLDQFSEERLIELADFAMAGAIEVVELARIALSVKQAKPVAWGTLQQEFLDEDRSLFTDQDEANAYSENCYDLTPLYATPQPAHTEQDGCLWNPDEDSVYSTGCGNEWQFTEGGLEDNKIKFCPYCGGKIVIHNPEI